MRQWLTEQSVLHLCNITVGRQANCNTVKLQSPVVFGAAPFKNCSTADLQTRTTSNIYYRPSWAQCFTHLSANRTAHLLKFVQRTVSEKDKTKTLSFSNITDISNQVTLDQSLTIYRSCCALQEWEQTLYCHLLFVWWNIKTDIIYWTWSWSFCSFTYLARFLDALWREIKHSSHFNSI